MKSSTRRNKLLPTLQHRLVRVSCRYVNANDLQIIQALEEMRSNIKQLKEDIANAKVRHNEATKDVQRIERDMAEFSNNKDSKLAELQGSLEKLKKALSKSNESIKPLH